MPDKKGCVCERERDRPEEIRDCMCYSSDCRLTASLDDHLDDDGAAQRGDLVAVEDGAPEARLIHDCNSINVKVSLRMLHKCSVMPTAGWAWALYSPTLELALLTLGLRAPLNVLFRGLVAVGLRG